MNWLNIYTPILRSPEFIGSDPVARATWLSIIAYCVEQENGGVVESCGNWGDRQWQQTCGVTRAEIDGADLLCRWEGDDLRVVFYPHDKERQVVAKREAGKVGGRSKSQAKTEAARANGAKHNPSTTQANTQAQPKQEPKGMEGKGREEEEKGMEVGRVAKAPPTVSDADWLKSLEANPAYTGIDVQREFAKCKAWCEVKKKQAPSRQRFLNWLNRVERPMAASLFSEPAVRKVSAA